MSTIIGLVSTFRLPLQALICAGALSAPTLWFWGRFLPPFSCFDGAFCPHTNETALPHP